ncbi:MAG: inositol monophosphatase family protein [Ilumatobacteraceae bacterium]
MHGLEAELELALELADLATAHTLERYERRSFTVDRKIDRSEVTEADRAAEDAIRTALQRYRPEHAMLGEEEGLQGPADAHWRWIVDPIDGTSNFVRGIPVWATLIALSHIEDGPVLGVVSAPAMGRRWWGGRDLGAFVDGTPIHVSAINELDEAQVCVTFNAGWDRLGLTPQLVELQQAAWRARGFGDFWQHMLVAEGAVEVAIDAIGVQPYDLAAIAPIVEAARGTMTDRHGAKRIDTQSAVSSNGLLHDRVIARLDT